MSVTSSFRSESSPSLCTDPPHPLRKKGRAALLGLFLGGGGGGVGCLHRLVESPPISSDMDLNTPNTPPPLTEFLMTYHERRE